MAKKINKKTHTIIFDIDSSSVGAALIQYGYSEDKKLISIRELFSVRQDISDGTPYEFKEFFRRTCMTLRDVGQEIYLQSLVPLDDIVINVAAPWSSSQKRILKHAAKKPFIFSQQIMDELNQHDAEILFDTNLDYHEYEVNLIQRNTLTVYGNGYPVRKPIGKEMSDVAIHSLTAVISSGTEKIFTDIIESIFHRSPRFISNTFVQYHQLQTKSPNIDDAVMVEISGEVTEVLVIQNDHLTHIGSIPFGTHGILRQLAEELNIPLEKGRTLIDLYSRNTLTEDSLVHDALEKSFRKWFRKFYMLLDEYSKEGLLPKTLILNTHKDVALWFEQLLMSEDSLREHMHTQGRIELLHLAIPNTGNDNNHYIFNDQALGIIAAYIGQE